MSKLFGAAGKTLTCNVASSIPSSEVATYVPDEFWIEGQICCTRFVDLPPVSFTFVNSVVVDRFKASFNCLSMAST